MKSRENLERIFAAAGGGGLHQFEEPTPIHAAAKAMAEAFTTKQDIYWSGNRAYQEAGGSAQHYLRDYTKALQAAVDMVRL